MSKILLFVIFYNSIIFISVKCLEKSSGVNLTVAELDDRCKRGFPLSRVEGNYNSVQDLSCTQILVGRYDASFNITVNGNVIPLDLTALESIRVAINGNTLYLQKGTIKEGICSGGKLSRKIIFVNGEDDVGSCNSQNGLTLINSDYVSFEIDGGQCEGKCEGSIHSRFNPGLRNLECYKQLVNDIAQYLQFFE